MRIVNTHADYILSSCFPPFWVLLALFVVYKHDTGPEFFIFFLYAHIRVLSYYCYGFNRRYEQAEFVERELEQVTEQIKSIIQTLNANQVTISV